MDEASLARRFRRHGEALAGLQRSPLYAELMSRAADDIEAGGPIAALYDEVSIPPGSVPALRLLAALHELVLSGAAPELAAFYPTAGGDRPPDGVWPVARATIEAHRDWVAERLHRTVQTNDVGRSAVLYLGLLWLVARTGRPIRLLEIGASAGLNLRADRYAYATNGLVIGDPRSGVRFDEPFVPAPDLDLRAAARRLTITSRAGCDAHPLNPADRGHRLRLLSYIWPDELARFRRADAAIHETASDPDPPEVAAADAADWLAARLTAERGTVGDEVTVVWHSILRQYLDDETWARLNDGFRAATTDVAWLGMEPSTDGTRRVELTVRSNPQMAPLRLAICNDHGPPIAWEAPAGP